MNFESEVFKEILSFLSYFRKVMYRSVIVLTVVCSSLSVGSQGRVIVNYTAGW